MDGMFPFCNKLSEILLSNPYLDMAKVRKKRPGCLLAAAWIKFPETEGITSVVSCYMSHMCQFLRRCPVLVPRKLVAP